MTVLLCDSRLPARHLHRMHCRSLSQAKLIEDSLMDLPRVTQLLKRQKHLRIVVEGHVNFGPTPQHALKLSASRAEAVMNKLIDQGIAALRMSSVGFGYDRPRYAASPAISGRERCALNVPLPCLAGVAASRVALVLWTRTVVWSSGS